MSNAIIYGLIDPNTNTIRYIGKTETVLEDRLNQHIYESRYLNKNYRHHWINGLLKQNLKPSILLIEECVFENWQEREIWWIAYLKEAGFPLVNGTAGGENPPILRGEEHPCFGKHHSEETKIKIGISNRGKKSFKGKTHTPETRRKISLANKGRKQSEKEKERKRLVGLGRVHSEETKQKISLANKNRKMTEDQIEKCAEAHRKKWIVIGPDGTVYKTNGIVKFCEDHSLSYSWLRYQSKIGKSNRGYFIVSEKLPEPITVTRELINGV